MDLTSLEIPDVFLIEPTILGDARGFFFESFNQKVFTQATGVSASFVQDNHSRSAKGVVRGLHYQMAPKSQGKIVRVVHGSIFDVAVDIRANSPFFGRWVGQQLDAENKKQLWIPAGFAHGFMALEDNTEIVYKTTDFYAPEQECSILWNDPDIGIAWPSDIEPKLSEKDLRAVKLSDAPKM